MPVISQRGIEIPSSPIRKLTPLANNAKARGIKVYHLNIGQPDLPTPESALEAVRRVDRKVLEYSPSQGFLSLRKKLAEYYSKYRIELSPDDIIVTSGGSEAVLFAFMTCLNPGDEIIVFAPFFPEYRVFIEGAGAKIKIIPADVEAFQIDFAAFEAAITEKTKAVIVNSPNNPSGTIYSEETVKKLASVLEESSQKYGQPIFLLADEPYREIVFKGQTVPFLPNYYDNTLVCYSWSKSLSLPGERMGYVLVPDTVADSELVYAAVAGAGRSLGYVNAPSLFQRVCAACVDVTADVEVYETNKNLLVSSLRDMGYHVVEPQGTFYMFPRTLESDDIAFCEKAKEFNLLIVPGTGFGCPGHARISYCVPTERAKRSLDAFEKLAKCYR